MLSKVLKPWSEERKPKTRTAEEALNQLMRLAARSEKCEGDARRLMRGWGVPSDQIEGVVARLVAMRFIDNQRYAEAFVREKVRLSGWGAYKIRQALQRKQIAKDLIDEALAQVDRTQLEERLKAKLEIKARHIKCSSAYDFRTKLFRYGVSLGYDFETVQRAVNEQLKNQDLEDLCDEF